MDIITNKLYGVWREMNRRCYSLNDCNYHKYGEKGIRVCKEWLRNCDGGQNGFDNFKTWAINSGYQIGLTIDRKNPYKDYTPDNCQWISYHEQNSKLTIRCNASSGYVGINHNSRNGKWRSRIRINGKEVSLGDYTNKQDAVNKRNEYILKNNLSYPIQPWIGDDGYKKNTYCQVYERNR